VTRRVLLPLLVLGLVLVPAVAGTRAATKVKKVSVHDNYYNPLNLKVKAGTTVKWVWPSDVGDTHDVNLGKRPKGVKAFHSELVATGYAYKRTLTKPGKYAIYCSLHDDMKMTITVTR
jgi:plastocyanin